MGSTPRSSEPVDIVEVLRRTQVFGGLDAGALRALAERVVEETLPKGQTIMVQGEPGLRMCVIATGAVKVLRRSPGGGVLELDRLRAGASFGEIALLDGGPRTATVETVEPTVLLSIIRADLLALLAQRPALAEPLLAALTGLVRRVLEREADHAFLDLRSRVSRRLLDMSGDVTVAHPLSRTRKISQADLAVMVGASRQRVNGALQALQADGCISLRDGGITIVSRALLESAVEW